MPIRTIVPNSSSNGKNESGGGGGSSSRRKWRRREGGGGSWDGWVGGYVLVVVLTPGILKALTVEQTIGCLARSLQALASWMVAALGRLPAFWRI